MTTPRARLLIVDDHVDFADSLKLLLELRGYEVDVACGCVDALRRIETSAVYDVVLLDLQLGDGSGLQVAGALKEYPTAVVILTAHATVPSAQAAVEHRVFRYLEKPRAPEHFEALFSAIEAAVRAVLVAPAETSRPATMGRRVGAWLERGWRRLRRIITDYDTEPVELSLALMTAARGAWMLALGGEWDALWVVRELPPSVWGALLLSIGVSRLVAIATQNVTGRSWAAGISCVAWTYLGFKYLFTATSAAVVPINLMMAVMSGWVFARLATATALRRA